MTRKHPENDNPNVQGVRELTGTWLCRSYSLKNIITCIKIRLKTDEEQGNTHPKQNPTYTQYVILERMGVDTVIRCFTPYFVPKIRSPASPNPGKM